MPCEDAPCCGCCDQAGDFASPELVAEIEEAEMWNAPCCDCECDCSDGDCGCCDCDAEDYEPDDSMDGDHDSAMASAGFGMDEDYGMFDDGG